MPPHFKQVTIIGVGLIGGSLGILLKQQGMADSIVGLGRSVKNLQLAVKVGAIDRYERDPQPALQDTDLVILATPVDSYASQVESWGRLLKPGTIVSDVGSIKGPLVERMEELLPPGIRFVGAHPIAGKEKSGVGVATPDLFQKALCIVTPTSRTDSDALSIIKELWTAAGSHVISIDPFTHDWILGAVSHLPHIVAFALMNALTDLQGTGDQKEDLLKFSGGGLRDTTRIAASSPEMWRDICLGNRNNLLSLIERYEHHLKTFKTLLQNQDSMGLEHAIHQAKEARLRLP
jgi:prephenate dehydrogenase